MTESRNRSWEAWYPFPSDESVSTTQALGLTDELHTVSMSEVKTMKKLASASSEEVILLEQHKSLIGFLAFLAIRKIG